MKPRDFKMADVTPFGAQRVVFQRDSLPTIPRLLGDPFARLTMFLQRNSERLKP